MKEFKQDLFEAFFWIVFILSVAVYYKFSEYKSPTKKEGLEIKRNRFYENCGNPNRIYPSNKTIKGKIKVLKWK